MHVNHGIVFVSLGYAFGVEIFEMEHIKGSSPYGTSTSSGDGSKKPIELKLAQAFPLGQATLFVPRATQ
ncbi:NAD(P)H dehydrogenase [Nymphaea thermarum]|nr:NAD(P)H dehydrogenase [Nymphaea thermarum]